MKLALIGVDITPDISTTHQKFWLDFALRLVSKVDNLIIISFTNFKRGREKLQNDGKTLQIYYLKPPKFVSPYEFFQAAVSRFLSLLIHKETIGKIIEENQINIVHFIDNFVFGMKFLKKYFQM